MALRRPPKRLRLLRLKRLRPSRIPSPRRRVSSVTFLKNCGYVRRRSAHAVSTTLSKDEAPVANRWRLSDERFRGESYKPAYNSATQQPVQKAPWLRLLEAFEHPDIERELAPRR